MPTPTPGGTLVLARGVPRTPGQGYPLVRTGVGYPHPGQDWGVPQLGQDWGIPEPGQDWGTPWPRQEWDTPSRTGYTAGGKPHVVFRRRTFLFVIFYSTRKGVSQFVSMMISNA